MKTIEKVVRNGKVAVLISKGYGAGWYSWNEKHPELLFHPKLVEMVEQNRQTEITSQWVKDNLGIDIYTGGAEDLEIEWLQNGTVFRIEEYDGAESIVTNADLTIVA